MTKSAITSYQSPLLVIIGETASGKSALALKIAEELGGEIVCADSRTVYAGMDVGTAKPNQEQQERVQHHLLDVVKPNQSFTVVDFKKQAEAAIQDITTRGKLPILVGGSGLYIDAVIFDYQFPASASDRDSVNPRHLGGDVKATKSQIRQNTLVVGMALSEETLQQRIENRVNTMFNTGLRQEVGRLGSIYDPNVEPLKSIGYGEWQAYFEGTQTIQQTKEKIIVNTRKLAKKQRTWFKRNQDINWFDNQHLALEFVRNWQNTTNQVNKV